jgi:hypothetical protein
LLTVRSRLENILQHDKWITYCGSSRQTRASLVAGPASEKHTTIAPEVGVSVVILPRLVRRQTVIAASSSLIHSLRQPLADLGVFGVFPTSEILAIRPVKVTARGPGLRSMMSHCSYSHGGCHGGSGFGFNASCTSSAVKPSPIDVWPLPISFVGDVLGVGGKKACIEASALLLPPMLTEDTLYANSRVGKHKVEGFPDRKNEVSSKVSLSVSSGNHPALLPHVEGTRIVIVWHIAYVSNRHDTAVDLSLYCSISRRRRGPSSNHCHPRVGIPPESTVPGDVTWSSEPFQLVISHSVPC